MMYVRDTGWQVPNPSVMLRVPFIFVDVPCMTSRHRCIDTYLKFVLISLKTASVTLLAIMVEGCSIYLNETST